MARNKHESYDGDIIGHRVGGNGPAGPQDDLFAGRPTPPPDADRARTPVLPPEHRDAPRDVPREPRKGQDTSREAADRIAGETKLTQLETVFQAIDNTGQHGITRRQIENIPKLWKGDRMPGSSVHPRVLDLLEDRRILEVDERDDLGVARLLKSARHAPHCSSCLVGNPEVDSIRECARCRLKREAAEKAAEAKVTVG